MTPKEYIEKAIEGGWRLNDKEIRYFKIYEDVIHFTVYMDRHCKTSGVIRMTIYQILLDPKSFQAVGKVEGWFNATKRWCHFTDEAIKIGYKEKESMEIVGESRNKKEFLITWAGIKSHHSFFKEYIIEEPISKDSKGRMHEMIDALAEGKSVEEYLKTL